jgi:cytochrome P450
VVKVSPLIDISSSKFIDNPYPAYQQLRATGSPTWVSHQARSGTPGLWLFSRYSDVATLLREKNNISKDVSRIVAVDELTAFDRMLLNMDPPQHTRLRAIVAPLFSAGQTRIFESKINTIVKNLLSSISPGDEVDFMAEFAIPLPILVVSDILGVPSQDMLQMKSWASDLLAGFDSSLADEVTLKHQQKSLSAMTHYLTRLVELDPAGRNGLIANLNQLRQDNGAPTKVEILSLSMLIVLAGFETTVNLLGNGLYTLLKNPGQLDLLREEPDLIEKAIDEMLRFESPLQRTTFRVAVRDFSIGGFKIEKGQQIATVIGAANRDSEQFSGPEKFDIRRNPNRHLAFGLGIHKCLGERLARAEARIAFSRLLEVFPKIRLCSDKTDWQQKTLFRGLKTLAVQFDY